MNLIYRYLMGFILITFSIIVYAESPSEPIKQSPCNIYFAAALFSMGEKVYNDTLVAELTKNRKYKIFLPQRDGFEFESLFNILKKQVSAQDIVPIEQLMIYYLDMGYFLKKSHIVIAVLDEDLDPGVLVEITYAKMMGKYVIGIRTDVRSPYGSNSKEGIHFFPMFQLDDYIFFQEKMETSDQLKQAVIKLTNILTDKINRIENPVCGELKNNTPNPLVNKINQGADLLFGDMTIEEIKSPQGMEKILNRFKTHKNALMRIYPIVSD